RSNRHRGKCSGERSVVRGSSRPQNGYLRRFRSLGSRTASAAPQSRGRTRREQEALSTAAVHALPETSWKQEVNRRLAEHRGRKPASQPEQQVQNLEQHNASRRAQEAAARVAARYAKAPSYSEVLAGEARAALRAAEAASEAAFHAKAAAESVLANIEANSAAMDAEEAAARTQVEFEQSVSERNAVEAHPIQHRNSPAPEIFVEPSRKDTMDRGKNEILPLSVLWAPELPVRSAEGVETYTGQGKKFTEDEWW